MKTSQKYSEKGMVSIIVTIVMMMVISMIVLGFAQISRTEQKQSLDRQLSSQAFLAAESGVNDAREVISQAVKNGQSIPAKTQCGPGLAGNPYYNLNPTLDTGVSYSCLLVTTKLNNIKQEVPADGSGVALPLHPVAPGRIQTLHLSWALPTSVNPSGCSSSIPAASFPAVTDSEWDCPYGVLRMDIVPTDTLSRGALSANQKTVFFYPLNHAGPYNINYGSLKGAVTPMSCTASSCTASITGMNVGITNYSMRFSSIYNSGTVTVTADGTTGPNMLLQDAQALVDVTGKAQDVLRRIEVRLALTGNGSSVYGIESGGAICKRFGISSSKFTVPNDVNPQDPTNPMCQPM